MLNLVLLGISSNLLVSVWTLQWVSYCPEYIFSILVNKAMGAWLLLLFMLTFLLTPGALTQDVVEVQCDGLLVNQPLHLSFKISRQDSHQSL